MSLERGRRLTHHEIIESIGKGGMGEVYLARDTKLGRDVAVKVLPEEFTRDRERLERFEREARLLAQLNHANIATLHGLEESDGVQFLVMELIEGETLHERIARGRIPVDEALALFVQIADGLEAAHAKGIVHRDLKPANIKITPDGKVKILDFGLAKAVVSEAPGQSDSPTLTRGTADGVILGTAPYMSPEQARGKSVDAQTDVWAFGCCLYEALTGRAAFRGDTVSDTLARVIEREPDWLRLPATTPNGVRTLLRRSLAKDRRHRLRHIGDAGLELLDKREVTATASHAARYQILAIASGVIALGLLWNSLWRDADVITPVTRTSIDVAPSEWFSMRNRSSSVAISPDGRYLAYVGDSTELHLRSLDQFDSTTISGSAGAQSPMFSPDSASVAFWADGGLKKVSVSGGAPTLIARTVAPRGASWGNDGMIVMTGDNPSGLERVSSAGGVVEPLTTPNRERREKSHRLPHVLPGGTAVLFTLVTGDIDAFDDAAIAVLALGTREYRVLLAGGTSPRYSPSGHIIYARGGQLWTVPFDVTSLDITGPPVAVVDNVAMSSTGGPADFDVSESGALVYAPGGSWGANRRLAWVDRNGNSEVVVPGPGPFGAPRISPDGGRIAMYRDDANASVWLYDRERTTLTRLTGGFDQTHPIWTPDGSEVTFASSEGGAQELVLKSADGSGESSVIVRSEPLKLPGSWSPDGKSLVFATAAAGDIWVQLVGEATPQRLMAADFNERDPMISPDGRWIAYTSDETGRDEIYLRSFPELSTKFQVSTDGGTLPRWPSGGRELFYWNVDRMMVVDLSTEGEPVGRPKVLFEADEATSFPANLDGFYDVAPNGQHFVMIEESEPSPRPTHLRLVMNWASELERLAPTGR